MAGDSGLRDSVEKLGLAALGAVALTAERADALADELSPPEAVCAKTRLVRRSRS